VSLDGYYAGPRQGDADASDTQSWLNGPEAAGFFRVTRWAIDAEAWRQRLGFSGGERNVNSDIIAETYESVGAYVMGRRMADGGEIPWGDQPPFRAPVFVVTHRPRPTLHRQGGTSFTYVTDGINSAIEQAREAARDKNVVSSRAVAGAAVGQHPLDADSPAANEADGAATEAGRGRPLLVGEHLGLGEPGRVLDSDVDVPPADPARPGAPVGVDAVADERRAAA
jgi:dihydrofolate reductase